MNQNEELIKLCSEGESYRDELWEKNFLESILSSCLSFQSKQIKQASDAYSYLFVEIKKDSTEDFLSVANWCSEKGVGLIINPYKEVPDYVFTYGMLWGFKHYGNFNFKNKTDLKEDFIVSSSEKFYVKEVDDHFLPQRVRAHLKEFFKQQGILDQKIMLISQDKKNYELCFSLESMNHPEKKEHEGILQALSWFFPNDYSLCLISEKVFPHFKSL